MRRGGYDWDLALNARDTAMLFAAKHTYSIMVSPSLRPWLTCVRQAVDFDTVPSADVQTIYQNIRCTPPPLVRAD
jgi:hypothetical protein